MAYYKAEFDANGNEVLVQQTRGPDSDSGPSKPAAWVNGRAVYIDVLDSNRALLPDWVSDFDRMDVYDVKQVVAWLVSVNKLPCKKCEKLFTIGTGHSTGFAGVQCSACEEKQNTCDDGGEHDYKCMNPRQKHNARVDTKYKCADCGRVRKKLATE